MLTTLILFFCCSCFFSVFFFHWRERDHRRALHEALLALHNETRTTQSLEHKLSYYLSREAQAEALLVRASADASPELREALTQFLTRPGDIPNA